MVHWAWLEDLPSVMLTQASSIVYLSNRPLPMHVGCISVPRKTAFSTCPRKVAAAAQQGSECSSVNGAEMEEGSLPPQGQGWRDWVHCSRRMKATFPRPPRKGCSYLSNELSLIYCGTWHPPAVATSAASCSLLMRVLVGNGFVALSYSCE